MPDLALVTMGCKLVGAMGSVCGPCISTIIGVLCGEIGEGAVDDEGEDEVEEDEEIGLSGAGVGELGEGTGVGEWG